MKIQKSIKLEKQSKNFNAWSLYFRPLNRDYQEKGVEVLRSTATQTSGSGKRKTHSDLQERVTGLWTNVQLFEKGAKLFPGTQKGSTKKSKSLQLEW